MQIFVLTTGHTNQFGHPFAVFSTLDKAKEYTKKITEEEFYRTSEIVWEWVSNIATSGAYKGTFDNLIKSDLCVWIVPFSLDHN